MKQSPGTESSNSMHAAPSHNPPIFRPKRRVTAPALILSEPAPPRAGLRFRISWAVAFAAHALVILAWLYLLPASQSTSETISEITFEEETPAPEQVQRVAHAVRSKAEPQPLLVNKNLREEAARSASARRERSSPNEFTANIPATNPNAGGSSLSNNTVLDIPGELGARNFNRPPARGAGSRSHAGAFNNSTQIKIAASERSDDESALTTNDFAANALAASSLFRNRSTVSSKGIEKNKYGVGVDLSKGSGAGLAAGEEAGGLFGAMGGGSDLGGGGYGRRHSTRGAGNGTGLGNGTEVGIAAGYDRDSGAMNLNDLITWMKAHPGTIPKLVQHDMEHHASDLASALSFSMSGKKYELFLSCNANDMLLRICLIEGNKFTMLKDNGIKEASNFLATGEVVRAGATIQSLITSRQAPGETAQQFYSIFWQWWEGARQ